MNSPLTIRHFILSLSTLSAPKIKSTHQRLSKKKKTPKMADSAIRFGIIGCAEIARKVSRAINLAPNAKLAAVGSRSHEKAARFAAENNFPSDAKIYGSYEALLDDPNVDAVYVPLPTSLHVRWAVLAAQKKKHLLLEKPVALNAVEFDAVVEACESNGVQFMDGTMWMHNPRTAKMTEFLSDKQRFGQLKSVCMYVWLFISLFIFSFISCIVVNELNLMLHFFFFFEFFFS